MIEQTDAQAAEARCQTGTRVKGEFRCARCGYGVAIYTELPACPMCRGDTWEPAPWRPFTRASALAESDALDSLPSPLA